MGLKARKIKTMIEEYADQCLNDLNSKLGTTFQLNIDWNCLPENIDGWNWQDDELKTCFYNSYFYPVETAFQEMFKDKMYKEAISEQVKTLKIQGGEYSIGCDVIDGAFVYKHIMSVNQRELRLNEHFNRTAINKVTSAIDTKLN